MKLSVFLVAVIQCLLYALFLGTSTAISIVLLILKPSVLHFQGWRVLSIR